MQSDKLYGQVALVTGGGRGIGRAIAKELAAARAKVAVVARTESQINETVAEIEAAGGIARAWTADVTDLERMTSVAAEIGEMLGPITLLVNNAGTSQSMGNIWETDAEAWRQDVEINLYGPYVCMRALLPAMIQRKHGRIINVASNVAIRPTPGNTAYSCSKAALLRLTDSVEMSVREHGIKVFAVSPGWVWTDMTRRAEAAMKAANPDFQGIPEQDVSPPEAVAELCVELAAGRADTLSGRYIHVQDNLKDMLARLPEVLGSDLYTLRMRGLH